MSVLCLICKEKLLNYSPGGSIGSLNQLVENVVIATVCGHLYHFECLQSWFRTQKLKKQNSADSEHLSNICPSCLTRVKEEDNRRVYLFEDHVESLEKARMLERQENLEIYCHQLEVQLQQLHRENDIMLNKILTPPPSPLEDYDTIVKNDRVVWMRKDEPPVTGVVLSIFKKEGKLSAKIKLDRKIRTTQRTSRLFGSFRLDKKQEITVPFDEIVLEKDVNQNVTSGNRVNGNVPSPVPVSNISSYGKSLSSTNIFPVLSNGIGSTQSSFRNSTTSLPDEPRRLFGIKESIHESAGSGEEQVHKPPDVPPRPPLSRSISYSPGFQLASTTSSLSRSQTVASAQSINSSNVSLDQQRDYVVISPSWMKDQQHVLDKNFLRQNSSRESESLTFFQTKSLESRSSPPDGKNKHVTFADDHSVLKFAFDGEPGNSPLSEQPFANSVNSLSPVYSQGANMVVPQQWKKSSPPPLSLPPKPKPRHSITESEESAPTTDINSGQNTPTMPPTFQLSVYETLSKSNLPISSDYIDGFLQDFDDNSLPSSSDNSGCFDVTLLSLLCCSTGFDQPLLVDNVYDTEFCRTVKWIIREQFVTPLRRFHVVQPDYSKSLKASLMHLCSGTIDVEELLTILFEFTYKMSPFINYSLDMCDYLHQFFIDFTDKSKIRSVNSLLEKSLLLQDNLQFEGGPDPALILQMPHSDDGIIHYEAIVPNLTMSIDHLIEKKAHSKTCYCDNDATLECKACREIHGSSAVLFCEKCKDLLEGIHQGNDHGLEISPIPSFQIPSTILALSAIICLKNNRYSVFLKDGHDTYSSWIYVHAIVDGRLRMKQLPGFGYWLESLLTKINDKPVHVPEVPSLLQKILKYSRVFIYIPVRTSEV